MWVFLTFIGGLVFSGYYLLAMDKRLGVTGEFKPYSVFSNMSFLERGASICWAAFLLLVVGFIGLIFNGFEVVLVTSLLQTVIPLYGLILYAFSIFAIKSAISSAPKYDWARKAFAKSLPILIFLTVIVFYRLCLID